MNTDDLIRLLDGIELPTAGSWRIAAGQPVTLQQGGWRRRLVHTNAAGALVVTDEPRQSALALRVTSPSGSHPDLTIGAQLAAATSGGSWRFAGSVRGTVELPITLDVTYHGVYRHGEEATAWLTVRADLPAVGRQPAAVLTGELNADRSKEDAA